MGILKRSAGSLGRLPVSFRFVFRNMLRKPGRNISTALGIAFSISLFLGFATLMDSTTISIDRSMEASTWDYEVNLQGIQPQGIAQGWEGDIMSIHAGFLIPTSFSNGTENIGSLIYALDGVESLYALEYLDGEMEDDGIALSKYLSEQLDIAVGDTMLLSLPLATNDGGIVMEDKEFKVSGIHSNLMGAYIFMDLEHFHEITGLAGLSNVVYLQMESELPSQPFENSLLTSEGVSSVNHSTDKKNFMEEYVGLLDQFFGIMALLSMTLAGAIVYNLFMINAAEMRRDYATMKALGTSINSISKLVYIEAGTLTLFGIALGAIGGQLLAMFMAGMPQMQQINLRLFFSWWGLGVSGALVALVVAVVSMIAIKYIRRIDIANVIRERTP